MLRRLDFSHSYRKNFSHIEGYEYACSCNGHARSNTDVAEEVHVLSDRDHDSSIEVPRPLGRCRVERYFPIDASLKTCLFELSPQLKRVKIANFGIPKIG